jgi:hypothetical protein
MEESRVKIPGKRRAPDCLNRPASDGPLAVYWKIGMIGTDNEERPVDLTIEIRWPERK